MKTVRIFAGFLLLAAGASAQVVTSTLYGSVLDPQGAAIPSAKVEVTNDLTAATASAETDATGEFTLAALQSGTYSIAISAAGFRSQKQVGLRLSSGQRMRVSYTLELGTVSQTVEVTAETPLVNTASAEQRSNLSTQQVTELPVTRRDWSNLLNLQNGVTVTGDGLVALNGLPPASFRITVDGTDSAADTERPSVSMFQNFNFIKAVSLEAIEEVNVAKGIASAEIANSMSGNVNISTKRGSNQFHGSVFELNQTENLNARNQFLVNKPAVVFNQYGGSLGGPIVRNRLFFFGVFEAYRLRGFSPLNGNVPTEEFRRQALAATPGYKALFDLFPLPNTPTAPGAVTGFFQGAGSEQAEDNHAVARADYHLTDTTILSGRYTRGRPLRQIPRVVTGNPRTWSGVTEVGTLNLVHTRPRWTYETRVGVNRNEVSRLDNIFALGLAGVGGAIGFSTGGEVFFKEGTTRSFEEIVGFTSGRHSVKFGGIFQHLGGGRDNVESPQVDYANVNDFVANIPNRVQVTFGVKQYRVSTWSMGFFVQDDFKVSRKLVLNLGLRWDYFEVPNEKDGRLFNRDGPFGTGPYLPPDRIWKADRRNFGPRIGFAYSLGESSATVIRGGAGIFHNPRPLFGGPVDIVQNALDEPFRVIFSRSDVLQTGNVLRYPVVNDRVLPLVKGPQALLGGTAIDPNWGYPFSYQWAIGFQHRLARDLVLESDYVGNRGMGLMMVRTWNQPDRITGVRPYPGFAQFRYRDGSESTHYNAWQSAVRKRFGRSLMFNVNYTWQNSISYTNDADLLLPGSPQDINNVRAEKGPSPFDIRHQLATDFLYDIPLLALSGKTSRGARLLLDGWQFAGIYRAQTGSALNVSQSSGLDSSRPDHVGGAVTLQDAESTLQFINRGAFAEVPIHPVSRLPVRPGNLGRNALRRPGLWNLDLSLSKNLHFTERLRLNLRAEMINSLNHTNFSGVETNITNRNFGRFTSTTGARIVQISGRFSF